MYQSANHNSCLLEVIIHIRGCLVIFDQVELILPFHWPTSCVSELYVFKSCEFSIAILVWFQTELLEYDAHYTQLNFLKTFSNFANQNITYACRNSMAWEDGRYSIKLKGSNEMEYHATSKTSLRPKVLSNGCMVSENHRYLFPPSSRPPHSSRYNRALSPPELKVRWPSGYCAKLLIKRPGFDFRAGYCVYGRRPFTLKVPCELLEKADKIPCKGG